MRTGVMAAVAVAMLGAALPARAVVLCQKKSGALFLRGACKRKETQVDPTTFGPTGATGATGPTGPTGPDGAARIRRRWGNEARLPGRGEHAVHDAVRQREAPDHRVVRRYGGAQPGCDDNRRPCDVPLLREQF